MYKIASQEQVTEINKDLFEFTKNSSQSEQKLNDLIQLANYVLYSERSLIFKKFLFLLQELFNIDISSVNPNFEPISKSSLQEKLYKDHEDAFDIESDYFIRMPPVNEYKIKVKISKIEKPKPRIDFAEFE